MLGEYVLALLFLWSISSIIIGLIGMSKAIGFWVAFLVSLFFSPLIGLIVVLASGSKADKKMLKHLHVQTAQQHLLHQQQAVQIQQMQMQQQAAAHAPPPPPASFTAPAYAAPIVQQQQEVYAATTDNSIETRLHKLFELKEKGGLTQGEYEAAKRKVLEG
jgi:hypothetical protein